MPKFDPSRTLTLRRDYIRAFSSRFKRLASKVVEFVEDLDSFGLGPSPEPVRSLLKNADRRKYAFETSPAKLARFREWFQEQVDEGVLELVDGADPERPWTSTYVTSGYKRGILRAFEDVRREALAESSDVYRGSKLEFLRSSFSAETAVGKIELLGTRSWEKLKGITADMGAEMNRILAQGIADGRSPRDVARDMRRGIEQIDRVRAARLARTEIIHAHAEGQLDGLERLGVDEVVAEVEWLTAKDSRVCPRCSGMNGKVMLIAEARGMIPLHPNCRCAWKPYLGKKWAERAKAARERFFGKKKGKRSK